MLRFETVTDAGACEGLWRSEMPRANLADLWEVRECFHRHYRRPPCFLVARDGGGVCGLLPMAWMAESKCYGCFPGETWHGKTWLEQNRIPVRGGASVSAFLERAPGPVHLRYLLPADGVSAAPVDEIGYLFRPPCYNYDIENYFREFSGKSAKRLKKELGAFADRGAEYRYDEPKDFDWIVEMNVARFGEDSYFADVRFREGFRDLLRLLDAMGALRMTAVLVGGEIAAADMGCVFNGTYTLLAGGTHPDYPGVAKVINTRHMARACEERIECVDFLCGDFSWKKLFHLAERPLHLLSDLEK